MSKRAVGGNLLIDGAAARKMLQSTGGIVVVDENGVLRFANPAAVELLAQDHESLVGHPFEHPIIGGEPLEVTIAGPDGERFVELTPEYVTWDGRVATVALLRDMTGERRAAQLERQLIHADRLASIGQLAAGVAHEINNPATFIHSNCSVMSQEVSALRTALTQIRRGLSQQVGFEAALVLEGLMTKARLEERLGEMSEMLDDCLSGIKRIAGTVRELSSFARIEDDKVEYVNPNVLVNVACKMILPDLKHRGELVTKLGAIPEIALDRAKITQVVVNLLVNAAHALDGNGERESTVTVETRKEGSDVLIIVKDTGCGISEDNLPKLFKPFFTTKPRELGTGLGLPLSQDIVAKHNGEIVVDSLVGVGSTFTVRLPEDTKLLAEALPERPRTPTGQIRRRSRLMIVDDEPMLRKALKRVLAVNHMVVEAEDGVAALEILRADHDFDVIVCDLMMPRMGGVELFREVRSLDRELSERMVFVTGGAMSDESRQIIEGYRAIVLEKPVPKDTLLGLVDRLKR